MSLLHTLALGFLGVIAFAITVFALVVYLQCRAAEDESDAEKRLDDAGRRIR